VDLRYFPHGFGSYHWTATDRSGQRWVITVDDLTKKGWLGSSCDDVFTALQARFEVATAVRERAGLRWVIAPVRNRFTEVVNRLSESYSIALFPYVEGIRPRAFDEKGDRHDRTEVIRLLTELHGSTPLIPEAPRQDSAIPELDSLNRALQDLDRPWTGGPFSEPTRLLLADHADEIGGLITAFERLALTMADRAHVLTHGEPHSGNVVQSGEGRMVMLDWDTVALAPPERDLWMINNASGAESDLYSELTGRAIDPAVLRFYGLRWEIQDIALFTIQLRESHEENEDTRVASAALRRYVEGSGRWDLPTNM
jgi:spectinomycin phosphotransferase